MSDNEEQHNQTFEQAASGASQTFPMQVSNYQWRWLTALHPWNVTDNYRPACGSALLSARSARSLIISDSFYLI